MNSSKTHARRCRGYIISEFAPALFVLLFLGFFPFLNLIALTTSYAACVFLNTVQLRVLRNNLTILTSPDGRSIISSTLDTLPDRSLSRPNAITAVNNHVHEANYANSPILKLAHAELVDLDRSDVTLTPATSTEWQDRLQTAGVSYKVRVRTRVRCAPYLTVPFFQRVPGLGRPIDFVVHGEDRVQDLAVAPDAIPDSPP